MVERIGFGDTYVLRTSKAIDAVQAGASTAIDGMGGGCGLLAPAPLFFGDFDEAGSAAGSCPGLQEVAGQWYSGVI